MDNNRSVLESFLSINNIKKSNAYPQFQSEVTIETDSNELKDSFEVAVDFRATGKENGKVVLLIKDNQLDVYQFPSDFWVGSTVSRLNGKTLIITGTHPNPDIGNYEVTITPH